MLLFASDYDGTLKQSRFVSSKTIAAIKGFRKAGHKFGIVTGRNLEMIVPFLKMQGIPYDFVIGANGGIIQVGEQVIAHEVMAFETVAKILKQANELKIANIGLSNGYYYGNVATRPGFSIKRLAKFFIFLTQRFNSKKLLKEQTITTIFLNDKKEIIKPLYEEISKMPEVEAYLNREEYLDIVPCGVSKAHSLKTLMEYYKTNQIYVIGDSLNDISMIEAFQGFAVEGACAEVKAKASKIFKDVKEALSYVETK